VYNGGHEHENPTRKRLEGCHAAGDDLRKRTIRMALSAIRLAEIDKGAPVDEATVVSILQKEVKSRQRQLRTPACEPPDLVESSQAEIAVLQEFLPSSSPRKSWRRWLSK